MTVATREAQIYLRGRNIDLDLASLQGSWTEQQYLKMTDGVNTLLEFTDGYIEELPMPTDKHQAMLEVIYLALRSFVLPLGGRVRFAPLRLQIRSGKQLEPDILLVLDANNSHRQNRFWLGADLVVEIVSEDDPERDTVEKVDDYAEAGIAEYWIVNPLDEKVTVLRLADQAYVQHGVFSRGQQATSHLLQDFKVDVDAVFDAD